MPRIIYSIDVQEVLEVATHFRLTCGHEYLCPEHVLFALTFCEEFVQAADSFNMHVEDLRSNLKQYFSLLPTGNKNAGTSVQFDEMTHAMEHTAAKLSNGMVTLLQLTVTLMSLKESWAAYELKRFLGDKEGQFLVSLHGLCAKKDDYTFGDDDMTDDEEEDDGLDDDLGDGFEDIGDGLFLDKMYGRDSEDDKTEDWHTLVTDIMELWERQNPLIGREAELDRTIQVLCRKDKNNPLHVGEPGVGKTALVYGLAARIAAHKVPQRLQACHIYQMDIGSLLAGAQFRGQFEKRLKNILEGAEHEGNAILYIDEIHTLVGTGRTSDSSLDAANMLKPYLERGTIRFIGSTTYTEFNRYMSKDRAMLRRFQQIDIPEPSIDEAKAIMLGLKDKYERFHRVTYTRGVVEYAVEASAKYVTGKHLPDKAIDLIDEAGAYLEAHPNDRSRQYVTRAIIDKVLTKTCKIDAEALKSESNEAVRTLEARIKSRVFGQDEAVQAVVEAVQMARAGLADDTKPLASLLFVGPTGVGKTELARTLAAELGVQLVRFDMSEYAEEYSVSKLIGAASGYVGYEDGGQLVDAILKSPNCVLLFDEIEKAHPKIYNILLQVMDYACLTDSKGRKADFRNVVFIMTSNAGAQYASRASVGFTGGVSRGQAMLGAVKKRFKPEFINRLSATVVFGDMTRDMAASVLAKKLAALQDKLAARKVQMTVADSARDLLLAEGFSPDNGAREMDRVIAHRLKPLLMREILFGRLAKGGSVEVSAKDGTLCLDKPSAAAHGTTAP